MNAPPVPLHRALPWIVAGTAAAVILVEISLTRLFSVLLYYHFSFLAVALALFGLAAGGVSASRLGFHDLGAVVLHVRSLLRQAAIALLALILLLVLTSPGRESILVAVRGAMVSAVPLFLLGKALAVTMALGRTRIHRLYAIDLGASAAAALLTIPLLARVQGPFALAVPAFLAITLDLYLSPPRRRFLPASCALILALGLAYAATRDQPLLPLTDGWLGEPVLERWNAHSRVRVSEWNHAQRMLVIDKTAASVIPYSPSGQTLQPIEATTGVYEDPSYLLERSPARVAIIGVGGGSDILPALASGAAHIHGFELNGRIVELLRDGLDGYVTLAHRPEVHLIHDEARHAMQHRAERYDVIRANLIDTWAATAAGGFVLAENGIYTVEAWRLFLSRLTPKGVLVMTRWHLPAAPAEAERLVALAAEALDAEGRRADQHLVAFAMPTEFADPLAGGQVQTITILASQRVFSEREVKLLKDFAEQRGGKLLVSPGPPRVSSSWAAMLTPASRKAYVNASPWAIYPPTDERPFFFLQLRPTDVLRFHAGNFGFISAVTVNGVRILLIAALLAIALAITLTALTLRGKSLDGVPLPAYGKAYFALLGVGYMAVQLALFQRLSVILGHPATALALVIATMLVGTGLGSALAGAPRLRASPGWTLAVPPIVLGTLVIGFGHLGDVSRLPSLTIAAVVCGLLTGVTGLALGVALPTGIRLFAGSGLAVTQAWALNGAFSVLGSVAGALGGLLLGSRGLILAALPCYLLAWMIVLLPERSPLASILPPTGG
jgi:spermidine synthase